MSGENDLGPRRQMKERENPGVGRIQSLTHQTLARGSSSVAYGQGAEPPNKETSPRWPEGTLSVSASFVDIINTPLCSFYLGHLRKKAQELHMHLGRLNMEVL